MLRRLLAGDALAAFDTAATANGNETVANFELCLRAVTTHIFPQRALLRQKRYMRVAMRKPRDMSTRAYSARLAEVNGYLAEFPPFEPNQMLGNDEIVHILEFGVPKTWQKNMVLQGFEPMIHTPNEIVEFCERHEFTEVQNEPKPGTKSKPAGKHGNGATLHAKPSVEASNKRKFDKTEKFCDLHQRAGHSTAECKTVQAQIQKMRQSWDSVKSSPQARQNWKNSNNSNSNNHNKTNHGAFKGRESVMALVKESLKELSSKKRKKEESNLQEEFEDFNIEDLANFTLSDDEEEESKTEE